MLWALSSQTTSIKAWLGKKHGIFEIKIKDGGRVSMAGISSSMR